MKLLNRICKTHSAFFYISHVTFFFGYCGKLMIKAVLKYLLIFAIVLDNHNADIVDLK